MPQLIPQPDRVDDRQTSLIRRTPGNGQRQQDVFSADSVGNR
jgi:hypothetical protein